jgi:hypothetical protein
MGDICERDIEKYLVRRVKAIGGEIRKVQWIGFNGAPDRLVMYKGATFVELKRPGKTLEKHQQREHDRMFAKGIDVAMINSFTGVDYFIGELLARP